MSVDRGELHDAAWIRSAYDAYEWGQERRMDLCRAVHLLMEVYSATQIAEWASTPERTVTPYQVRHWDRKYHEATGEDPTHYRKVEAGRVGDTEAEAPAA